MKLATHKVGRGSELRGVNDKALSGEGVFCFRGDIQSNIFIKISHTRDIFL
jgi:hypothetical protein